MRTHRLFLSTSLRGFGAAALALAGLSSASFGQTIYVDANLTTGADDGSSWANAFQGPDGLKTAVSASISGQQVWVADGVYRPTSTGARNQAFTLKNGVEVYGSFLGGEASLADRPALFTAPSTLTGDLGTNDPVVTDNSFHVVNGTGTNNTAVLDGFVISGGNANSGGGNNDRGGGILCFGGASPTISNCRFIGNRSSFGGGAGYINSASPRFLSCHFIDNIGGAFGGAFDMATASNVRFDRCLFRGNRAARAGALEVFATNGVVVTNSIFWDNLATGSGGGGGLWAGNGGSTQLRNCTFVANRATSNAGGGVRNQGAGLSIANCIFWDNEGVGGAQGGINQVNGATTSYCLIEGGLTGTGNLSVDPQFVDLANGDFHLNITSPAIDAGSSNLVPSGIVLDHDGNGRIADVLSVPNTGAGSSPFVDMGVFEIPGAVGFIDPFCTVTNNSSGTAANLSAEGSLVIAMNNLNLSTNGLPANQFGYYLMSGSSGSSSVSNGFLCLGAPQFRFNSSVLNSGTAGVMDFSPDMNNLPQGQMFTAGSTWYFQLWYRDVSGSNFSNNIGFTWL